MERNRRLKFEARIDIDGRIEVPRKVLRELGTTAGKRYIVQVSERELARELAVRGINDEEIEAICAAQLEPAEQVIRFLLSERSLVRPLKRRRMSPGRDRK